MDLFFSFSSPERKTKMIAYFLSHLPADRRQDYKEQFMRGLETQRGEKGKEWKDASVILKGYADWISERCPGTDEDARYERSREMISALVEDENEERDPSKNRIQNRKAVFLATYFSPRYDYDSRKEESKRVPVEDDPLSSRRKWPGALLRHIHEKHKLMEADSTVLVMNGYTVLFPLYAEAFGKVLDHEDESGEFGDRDSALPEAFRNALEGKEFRVRDGIYSGSEALKKKSWELERKKARHWTTDEQETKKRARELEVTWLINDENRESFYVKGTEDFDREKVDREYAILLKRCARINEHFDRWVLRTFLKKHNAEGGSHLYVIAMVKDLANVGLDEERLERLVKGMGYQSFSFMNLIKDAVEIPKEKSFEGVRNDCEGYDFSKLDSYLKTYYEERMPRFFDESAKALEGSPLAGKDDIDELNGIKECFFGIERRNAMTVRTAVSKVSELMQRVSDRKSARPGRVQAGLAGWQ